MKPARKGLSKKAKVGLSLASAAFFAYLLLRPKTAEKQAHVNPALLGAHHFQALP